MLGRLLIAASSNSTKKINNNQCQNESFKRERGGCRRRKRRVRRRGRVFLCRWLRTLPRLLRLSQVRELLPAHARPAPTTATTATTTAAATTGCACRGKRNVENETEVESSYEYVYDYDLPVATIVPALCENTSASFSELFSALHENPKFSPASLGASLVTLVFGIHLLRRGQRRRLPAPPVAEDGCAWTLLEALASLALTLGGFALLVFLYSQPQNYGNEFLVGMSLGAALQAGVVLWSSYGNLFFDLRTLGSAFRRRRSFFFSAAAPAPEGRELSEAIPAPARVEEVAEVSVAIGTGRPCRVV